jgi:DNA mismatch endonuclease (patch repair protein)
MADRVSVKKRSEIMSRVGKKNTAPEMTVRRLLHRMGFRFRLHEKRLPGCPDIVFRSRKKVIFVHGCFWHGHKCRNGNLPKSNIDFWQNKIHRNRKRDAVSIKALRQLGWQTLVVWSCGLKNESKLAETFDDFLGPPGPPV